MRKKHFKPEFQVIQQTEANAKFFVASVQSVETTSSTASSYDSNGGGDIW